MCLVSSCFIGSLAFWMALVMSQRRGVAASQEIPKSKPYNLYNSSSKCSKFCLYTRTGYNCLLLGLPGNRRKAKKNIVSYDGAMICWVTHPSGVRVSIKLEWTISSI